MEKTRNIKLILEFDGTGLAGWQRQAGPVTVQGLVEEALSRLTGRPVTVIGAGRTDAGVHARGMAANFRTSSPRALEEIVRGGNSLLPPQVAILSAEEVPLDFHARYSAKSKVYDYDILVSPVRRPLAREQAWLQPPGLDPGAMRDAASRLPGEHDFAGFQSTGSSVKTTVRTMLDARIEEPFPGLIRAVFEADGFLRHMVRALVGTLALVGRGRLNPAGFEAVLLSRDRSRAGPTAPARGLFLREVRY
ncbi:MAG: tRNA pseudouridine(38-40) synthase TruA [Pseudomonadota bacterium]